MYNVQVNSFQNMTFDSFISLNIFLRQNFYMGNLHTEMFYALKYSRFIIRDRPFIT